MRINYSRLVELNKEALIDDDKAQLTSFYIIQKPLEDFVNGQPITEEAKNLLLELGVLTQTEDTVREPIVEPFNFSQHGSQNS
jgi:hypothetical protein